MSRSGFNNTMNLSFKLILHRIKGHNKPWNKASSTQSIKHKKTNSSHFFMTYMLLRTKRFVVISFFIVVSSVELLLRRKCPRANMFCDNVPTALGGRPTSGAFDIELFWFDTEKSYQYPKL